MTRYEFIDSIIQKYDSWSGDNMEPVCKNCAKELQRAGFGRSDVQEYFAKDGIYNEETGEGTWDKDFVDCIVNELPINSSRQIKSSFVSYIAVYTDGDCRGYIQNESSHLTQDINKALHFKNENEAIQFRTKLLKHECFDNDELYIEGGYIDSSRQIKSSQKGMENVVEGTQYDDYHIDTNGMGILSVENIIEEIEGRGNQAVLTVQTSSGSTNHSQFGSKDWKEYKDSVNNAGNAITDVWITEVEGGSYIRNSRRPVKSSVRWSNDDYIVETFEEYGNGEFYVSDKDTDGRRFCKTFWSEKDAVEWAKNNPLKKVNSSRQIKSARYIATDPESGEVLGSADTYEEAVNEWGEDVTITDSKATENQEENRLFSSWDNDTPRGEGWLAHDDGKQKNECPYERGTDEYEDWIDGWEAAYQEVNSSCKPIKSSISATALEEQLNGQFWTRTEDFEDEVNDAGWDVEDVNNEYATISNDKGSQYEVRFYDHGEGRSFTMESFKCIYCDEDDRDDEIESSNQLNGDKAFLSNIVSSVLTQSMTQEQAVKRIALRNNCNQAFARNILSSAMEDTTLIQSGVMAIADDINKDFNIDGDIESWFTDYVPREGAANTVGGEILRAFAQIRARYYNDGDKIGVGMGKDTVNPAARYLVDKCVGWTEVSNIEEMLSGDSDINKDDDSYKEWIEDCKYSLEDYLRNNEDYFHAVNKDDMWNYKTEDDNRESVDEIFIMDNDNNEYWFQGGGDGWHCYTINYSHEPKYHVDEWVDDLDDIPDTSGDFCDFELDGFEYSAEKSSNNTDWMITDVRLPDGIVQLDEEWETSDFEPYDIYDNQGREISINDLY